MFYKPENRDRNLLPHDPIKAIVAPRPIGWISTLSKEGWLTFRHTVFLMLSAAGHPC